MTAEKIYTIIVAGGSGSRMNAALPKQFLEINDKPIIIHTIEKFLTADDSMQLIIVLPETEMQRWNTIASRFNLPKNILIAKGGSTRMESVKNGLVEIKTAGTVAIHDAARPLLSVALIQNCFITAKEKNNATPAIACPDSVRQINQDGENKVIDRNTLMLIQTPQCFDVELIKAAFEKAPHLNFTDDASVFEAAGHDINLIAGEKNNFKITTPEDLELAKYLLK